ncbi:Similar to Uncharacterized transcriptional regulatory protein C3C7.04; acc. no. O14130 [Pyronema omphalodes CBS 100304]|uniref:Similar to Uncharacterized transcriptional regulatory protein C3C7.04 acc. no. O14130 n=1 Tax=Pyronema omphalodes (strain CBS 100304) TaxID=1076935 RepID=U4L3Y1_PYROM|nr:Similar to Uncharacterized transcriptional regulatory protein C3C7.04; acc. no. O14130 [Pyronema omphalodes CBS 100304]
MNQSSPTRAQLVTNFTACEACRKRKKRCDGRIDSCQHCTAKGIPCIYTIRKSRPRSHAKPVTVPAPDVHVTDLDLRLRRVEEAVFRNLDLQGKVVADLQQQRDDEDEADRAVTTIAKDARSSPRPRTPTASTPQPTSPRFEGSISTDSILFIGSSSPFSFISHKGVEWINSRLGNEHFSELIRRAEGEYQQLLQDQEEVPRGEYSETPELRELYINEYFHHIAPITPLFSTPPSHPAAISILLSLGAQHLSRSQPHHLPAAAHYYHLTSSHLSLLLLSPASLATIQSLLGLTLYLRESDAVQPIFSLLGLAHSIGTQAGLHRDPKKLHINDPESVEARVNTFWILYVLDKEAALRTGRPAAVSDADFDVPLPSNQNLLQRVKLAQIMAAACRVNRCQGDQEQSAATLATLSKELYQWHLHLPQLVRGTSWEEDASILHLRWGYLCALQGVDKDEADRWVKEEVERLMNWTGPRTKAWLYLLVAAGGGWLWGECAGGAQGSTAEPTGSQGSQGRAGITGSQGLMGFLPPRSDRTWRQHKMDSYLEL